MRDDVYGEEFGKIGKLLMNAEIDISRPSFDQRKGNEEQQWYGKERRNSTTKTSRAPVHQKIRQSPRRVLID